MKALIKEKGNKFIIVNIVGLSVFYILYEYFILN